MQLILMRYAVCVTHWSFVWPQREPHVTSPVRGEKWNMIYDTRCVSTARCEMRTCLINSFTQWRPHARKAMELTHNQPFVTSNINAETVNKYAVCKWIPCSAEINDKISIRCWPWWPTCLRRGSAGQPLAGLRVRIPLAGEKGTNTSSECCVLSGRGLWDEPITRLEVSYRLRWSKISRMTRPLPRAGLFRQNKKLAHDTQQR